MTQHSANSSYREKLIEHLFVGELLKLSWLHHGCSLEVAKPEVDNSGYDIIVEAPGFVRHIQLKTSIIGGRAASQKVHTHLASKPAGCVVWIYFDADTLQLGPFLYFAVNAASLDGRKTAKHTKGNKDGLKAERKNICVIPKRFFTRFNSIEDIYAQLFGGQG